MVKCFSTSILFLAFRYYYQLLTDGSLGAVGCTGIIRFFGWKKVAIITQNENLYIVVRKGYELRGLVRSHSSLLL